MRVQIHQLICVARHRGNDDGALVPCIHFPLHMLCDIADPVEVANRRPTEFHHQKGHYRYVLRAASGVWPTASVAPRAVSHNKFEKR